jgi:hypothetical protein
MSDRYRALVSLLEEILQRLDAIERDVDAIDRTLRPYGDGTKVRGQ